MKKNILLAIAGTLAILFGYGCNNEKPANHDEAVVAPVFDLSNAKTEIEAMNKKFMDAVGKGDSVAVAGYYTADAKFMGPNAPAVVGRANIQSDIGGLIKAGLTKLVLTTSEVWGNENFVGEEGVMTLSTADGKLVDQGKYIVLWKKEDGSWKLHRDIYNSDLPLPKAK